VLVRERFEKAKMVKQYFSESMLQNCSDLYEDEELMDFSLANSDCALLIEMADEKYQLAVEYEISSKQASRYVSKLTDYYLCQNVDAVFYICGNAMVEKLISKADEEVRGKKESILFTCLEETFHSSEEFLPFVSAKMSIVKIF
jgi:hypothetical protein